MPAIRVLQVSDTHLSRRKPYFVDNWAALASHVAARRPDLVINTGDIALDGPHAPDDLAYARELHEALPVPVKTLPGNHDVGDNPAPGFTPKDPIGEAALAAYRALLGADWWAEDVGAWRFVALNAQLLGSGLADEAAQWRFLEASLASVEDRPIALWLHKPLFNLDPGEAADVPYRYVVAAARDRLLELMRGTQLRLVASGHTHQSRRTRWNGIELVWCPSSAFILKSDAMQARIGTKEVGFVEYAFEGREVAIDVRRHTLAQHDIADFPGAYGPAKDLAARMKAAAQG